MRSLPFSWAALKGFLTARLQVQQHRLDVLAGAEAVDAKIHATARELPLAQIADLDRVIEPAP